MGYYVECPYCEAAYELEICEGEGMKENTIHDVTCRDCSKSFWFETEWQPEFTTYKHCKDDDPEDVDHLWDYDCQEKNLVKKTCEICGSTETVKLPPPSRSKGEA